MILNSLIIASNLDGWATTAMLQEFLLQLAIFQCWNIFFVSNPQIISRSLNCESFTAIFIDLLHRSILLKDALAAGQLTVSEWIKRKTYFFEDYVDNINLWESAVQSGNLEMLEWVKGVGCPLDLSLPLAAAKIGNVDIL